MRTSSAKAKGRRACQEVKELLHKYAPELQDGDILVPASSVPGADLHLSPLAKMTYPFAIEAKNQEHIAIWAALEQSESHVKDRPECPILFFKRNRSKLYVALDAETFLRLFIRPEID